MAKTHKRNEWPVLKRYDQSHLRQIALPLGGIGTGTVSLGGLGNLRDWEIANRPAKGFNPHGDGLHAAFFAIHAKPAGGQAATRALMGAIDTADYGDNGCAVHNHGLPRFAKCSFAAAYPLGQVFLSDPAMPVSVTLQAFNPLAPVDTDISSIPVAVLRYIVTNRTNKPVTATVCGTMPNSIGSDGTHSMPEGNANTYREGPGVRGLCMTSAAADQTGPAWGTMAMTTTAKGALTYRTAWRRAPWGTSVLDFWDDFSADGKLEPRPDSPDQQFPVASLAVEIKLPPKAVKEVTFLITWHFPNRYNWWPRTKENCCGDTKKTCLEPSDWIGNHYATQYTDAWAVAERVAGDLPALEARTVQFVRAVCDAKLPEEVKDAALSNLSTLRTQTCFRTPDGHLYGWEGCGDTCGCCDGSCTHVWNYENTVAFLFGDLAMSMRDVEFAHATGDDGYMSFRAYLPLERAKDSRLAAADGQMGCIIKMYRDWQLSGDTPALERLWPKVKKALAFCWVPGGWDADRDGVMEGCQHNTMDVEYYGPNGQMGVWYLGALRAG
ncbi:MAG: GH116 family glycosyl-hydrolase, partial [Planctomycetota bacterium]